MLYITLLGLWCYGILILKEDNGGGMKASFNDKQYTRQNFMRNQNTKSM